MIILSHYLQLNVCLLSHVRWCTAKIKTPNKGQFLEEWCFISPVLFQIVVIWGVFTTVHGV